MNGVEGSTYAAATVHGGSRLQPPPPSSGTMSPLTKDNVLNNGYVGTAQEALSQALSSSGFIDIRGGVQANFRMLVSEQPDTSVDIGDLKPGAVADLLAWVRSKIEADPEAAVTGQAHADPQRAVHLLG